MQNLYDGADGFSSAPAGASLPARPRERRFPAGIFRKDILPAGVFRWALLLALVAGPTGAVLADDYSYKGRSSPLDQWGRAGAWTNLTDPARPAQVPGAGDRAIFAGTATKINTGSGASPASSVYAGTVWIPEGSSLTALKGVATEPAITIGGIGGTGVQSDVNRQVVFFREARLAGDIAIVATHAGGGGFDFTSTLIANGLAPGVRINGYTLTLDPRNAVNVFNIGGNAIIDGAGNLVKDGAGVVNVAGALLHHTGTTWIRDGGVVLSGGASLRSSSTVRVDGRLDISGTTDVSGQIPGGTGIAQLTGAGSVALGARNLTIEGGGSVFSGSVTGSGRLILTQGVTQLTGASDYSGGTELNGGRLDIAGTAPLGTGALHMAAGTQLGFLADGLAVSNAVDLASGGSATIDTGAFTGTLSGPIAGAGGLVKEGTGALVLAGQSGYAGDTRIEAGTLRAGAANVFSTGGTFRVAGGAVLDMAGHDQTLSGLDNAGTVMLGGLPGTTLTVRGDYAGSSGTLVLNGVLAGDDSASDRLVVEGDTSGSTLVRVVNLRDAGAPTVEGIRIVRVGGQSDGVFSLAGDYAMGGDPVVVSGAYAYRLYKNGVSTPGDGHWYLRSSLVPPKEPQQPVNPGQNQPNQNQPGQPQPNQPQEPLPHQPVKPDWPQQPGALLYQAGAPLYEVYPQVLQSLNRLPTLQQRVGERYWAGESGPDGVTREGSSVWGRIEGAHDRSATRGGPTGAVYGADVWTMQAGLDGQLYEGAGGRLIGGITGQYGTVSSDVASASGRGTVKATGYGIGGTLTWYGGNGFYLDGQGQANWFDGDLFSHDAGRALADGNRGFGYALSLEAGRRMPVAPDWTLTPQAQLVYSAVDFDSFTDAFGARVSLRDGDGLTGRIGLAATNETRWTAADGSASQAAVYGIANLYYEFLGDTKVDLAGVAFDRESDRLSGGAGLGGSFLWGGGKYALYGEGLLKAGLAHPGDDFSVSGTVGLKVSF